MDRMKNARLFHALATYHKTMYPFAMPGHRLGHFFPADIPYLFDISEYKGFDNLQHPTGLIEEFEKKIAKQYKTRHSFFLTGGSTCGVLSSISCAATENDTILMERNAHMSAYHAVCMRKLKPVYLTHPWLVFPGKNSCLSISSLRMLLDQNPQIKVVFLTSPNYQGIVSDIFSAAKLCHERNILLLVDEAHGAHFYLDEEFPSSALAAGADLVIHSLHKTLPYLTPSAVLHLNSDRIAPSQVKKWINRYQTSSPSYLLMGMADYMISYLEEHGKTLVGKFKKQRTNLEQAVSKLTTMRILQKQSHMFDCDPFKINLQPFDNCGKYLYKHLHSCGIEAEYYSLEQVLLILSLADSKSSMNRLIEALNSYQAQASPRQLKAIPFKEPVIDCSLWEADQKQSKKMQLNDCVSFVSASFLIPYPPGVPIVCPGERFTKELVEYMEELLSFHIPIMGMEDGKVSVCI